MKDTIFKLFSIVICMIPLLSCNDKKPEAIVRIDGVYKGIEVEIKSTSGEAFEGQQYLALPFNHGQMTNQAGQTLDFLVLGKPIDRNKVIVSLIGVVEFKMDGKSRKFILSAPENETYQIMEPFTFNDFVTKYSSIKQITETWFLNFKGMGKVNLIGWYDDQSAKLTVEKFVSTPQPK